MSAFDFATIGDNCVDNFMLPVGLSAIGGNAVNVAVHLRKQGFRTAYFGAVGRDVDGKRTLECLQENGVIVDHVHIRDVVTAYTDLYVDPTGDRVIAFEEFGACRGYRPTESDVQKLSRMRHVHIGWFDDDGTLVRYLSKAGVSVSKDVAVNSGAQDLSIAFNSTGPHLDKTMEIAEQMLAEGAALSVVTCGACGSLATDGQTVVEVGAKPTKVSDTTGAGDTFIANFVAAHMQGRSLQKCLESGRDAAAITCTHLSGFLQRCY